MPSVVMCSWLSNAITAPWVMVLASPGDHSAMKELGMVDHRHANEPTWAVAASLGATLAGSAGVKVRGR